ncbi:hypothetical protein GCM10010151_48160 [Actinoallomurus spadix]|uniref:Uncharacterized protein n=1 Tax=Actinoallomurus spadix TaxID=79912 RepID=A0ABP3GVD0_9ACTN
MTTQFRSAKSGTAVTIFHVFGTLKTSGLLHSSRNPVSITNAIAQCDRPLEGQVDAEDAPKARAARPPTAPEAGGVAG